MPILRIFAIVLMSNGKVGESLIVGELRELPNVSYTLRPGDEVLAIDGQALPSLGHGEASDRFWSG